MKLYTEIFRLLWTTILTAGGGTVGLLLGEVTEKRWLFAVADAGVTVVCGEISRCVFQAWMLNKSEGNITLAGGAPRSSSEHTKSSAKFGGANARALARNPCVACNASVS